MLKATWGRLDVASVGNSATAAHTKKGITRRVSVPTVVLIGPPGSGKSTIGRRLSRALSTRFTDTDEAIEQRMGKTCGEVFFKLGEPEFRRIEERVVAEALTHNGIASFGGGAVISQATRDLLVDHNVVCLEISIPEGVHRIAGNNSRPVLQADDPEAHYRALYKARRAFYEDTATFKVRSDERSPQRVIAEILSYLDGTCDEA